MVHPIRCFLLTWLRKLVLFHILHVQSLVGLNGCCSRRMRPSRHCRRPLRRKREWLKVLLLSRLLRLLLCVRVLLSLPCVIKRRRRQQLEHGFLLRSDQQRVEGVQGRQQREQRRTILVGTHTTSLIVKRIVVDAQGSERGALRAIGRSGA